MVAFTFMSCSAGTAGNSSAAVSANAATDTKTANENMTKVKLETSLGDIVVELYNETPKHRDNFIKLVKEGFYDGVLFHRVINNFMIQAGDPESKTAGPDTPLGGGDPGYTIEAEFVYPKYFHKRGVLAAARTGDEFNPERRSSGSQFYIVTGRIFSSEQLKSMLENLKQETFRNLVMNNQDKIAALQANQDTEGINALQNEFIHQTEAVAAQSPYNFTDEQIDAYTSVGGAPHLDGQYTVFGEVVEGMDVVDRIQNTTTGRMNRPTVDIKIIKASIVE